MGIRNEAKDVVLLEELPESLQNIVLEKVARRSQIKSIQREIEFEKDYYGDYD